MDMVHPGASLPAPSTASTSLGARAGGLHRTALRAGNHGVPVLVFRGNGFRVRGRRWRRLARRDRGRRHRHVSQRGRRGRLARSRGRGRWRRGERGRGRRLRGRYVSQRGRRGRLGGRAIVGGGARWAGPAISGGGVGTSAAVDGGAVVSVGGAASGGGTVAGRRGAPGGGATIIGGGVGTSAGSTGDTVDFARASKSPATLRRRGVREQQGRTLAGERAHRARESSVAGWPRAEGAVAWGAAGLRLGLGADQRASERHRSHCPVATSARCATESS